MFSRTESIYIEATPAIVFDYVSDVSRHPEWAHDQLEITMGPEPQKQAGATFDYETHFMGNAWGKGIVTEADPPHSLTYECEDKDGRYRWTFDLQPEGPGTRLTHRMLRLKAPAYFKVLQPMMYPIIGKRVVVGGLKNIKAKVESFRPAPN